MTKTQYNCPICGTGFGSTGAVRAHITSKTDGEHKGKSGNDFRDEEIPRVGVEDDAGQDVEREPAAGAGVGDGAAPEFPAAPDGGAASSTSTKEIELPCGHESFDPDDDDVPDEVPFDVECGNCGDSWTVTDL